MRPPGLSVTSVTDGGVTAVTDKKGTHTYSALDHPGSEALWDAHARPVELATVPPWTTHVRSRLSTSRRPSGANASCPFPALRGRVTIVASDIDINETLLLSHGASVGRPSS